MIPFLIPSAGSTPGYRARAPLSTGGVCLRDNSLYVTGASGIHSTHFKIEAEAPFSAVRVWVADKNPTGTPPTYVAIVAATETGALDTVSDAYLPTFGGVVYNNMQGSSSNYGWRSVTWNGASSITIPNNTYWQPTNARNVAVSDWISCASLPRTDVAGGRPMALLRISQQTSGGVFTQGNSDLSTSWGASTTQPFYRVRSSNNTGTNDVATLSNVPSGVNAGLSYELYAWLEFLYDVPARNVAFIGDSRDSSAYNPYGTSWMLTALGALSTQSKPIGIMNVAGSGHAFYEYILLLQNMLAAGYAPTDVVMPAFSQNSFQQNQSGAENEIGANLALIYKLAQTGTQIWMTTDYAVNGYNGVAEQARQFCVQRARQLAKSGVVNLIDTDPLVSDYTTPSAPVILAAYNQDNVHCNAAGQAVLSNALASAWR